MFWDTLRRVQDIHPFHLLAYVILPDHFHWLMQVKDKSGNFSRVLHSVKRNHTLNYKEAHGISTSFSLWQDRFWDHVIRNADDLNNHFDYIHWNPVKHGLVPRPENWAESTFVHWRDRGYYDLNWGHAGEPPNIEDMHLE